MNINKSFSKENKKRATLALCIVTYIMVYLCRLNFSSAVLKISAAMDVTTAAMGVVGSLFFIAYALGQLINGFIGDRVSPVKFIIVAIIGTGAINIAMTFADSLWLIKILWVLNGYFQSVFWGSCNRLLSYYYGSQEHHIISTGMSLSMVMSYILSWAILGKLLVESSWQNYFLIPGIIAGFMLIVWFIFAKFEKTVFTSTAKNQTLNRKDLLATMNKELLWLICLTCIFTGLVKEGIGLWAPVIFLTILGGNINQSLLLIVFIPLGNFFGIMLAEKLLKRKHSDTYKILISML
ncbi:MAG: MFS transporter, partial [Clostridiales bacterium]